MSGIHAKQHALNSEDHLAGTTPSTGEHNLPATSAGGTVVEVTVEAQNAAPGAGGKLVRRADDGHLKVPGSGQSDDEAISYGQAVALAADGIYKSSVHSVVADHTAATVGDGDTGGPALAVNDLVINTTDKKIYKVASIAGGTTGDLVTWDAGTTPTTPERRVSNLTSNEWHYDVDAAVWVDAGSSSHARQHSMTSPSDHTAGNWKFFHSDGAGAVQELALGAAGAPLLSGGPNAAPLFGTMLIASAVVNAAGATPVDSDVTAWGNNTLGVVVGTGGRVFGAFKNATDVYFVELTAI